MPTVNEVLTNFNSGNYHGRLHYITPEDTPFTTMLGGFADGGGQVAYARTFEWQLADLRGGEPDRQRVDAADAPPPSNRRREPVSNVLQTHTESVSVGFERMAQHQQFNVPGNSSLDAQNVGQGPNPVTAELPWQVTQGWKQIKLDVEASLLSSTFNAPSSNANEARTRGIIDAIETNVVSAQEDAQSVVADADDDDFTATNHGYEDGDTVYLGGTAPAGTTAGTPYFVVNATANTFQLATSPDGSPINLTGAGSSVTASRGKGLDDYLIEYAMQGAYDEGGLQEGDTRVLMLPSIQKMNLTNAYRKLGLAPESRTVFGVNVMRVETSFGGLNVVLNRHLPNDIALALSFEQLVPWHRAIPAHDDIPGGITFAYTVARTGNRTQKALYTSIGLEYGNEKAHAKITGLSVSRPTAA